MNILIVGALGLLGRRLAEMLVGEHAIHGVVRKSGCSEKVNYIEADLSKLSEKVLPKRIDVVYYLAQSKRFREFPAGAVDMFEINVHAPLKLAEWARTNSVRKFFYISSGGVYRKGTGPFRESQALDAGKTLGFYPDTKLCAEILLRNYSEFFENFAILRPFFVYGPGQDADMLLPRLIRNVREGREISLNGEDGIRINPIYVDDAAAAMKRLLLLPAGSYLFNIAGAEVVTMRAVSEMIGRFLGKSPVFAHDHIPGRDFVADIALMEKMLHVPKVTLSDGIGRVIGRNDE